MNKNILLKRILYMMVATSIMLPSHFILKTEVSGSEGEGSEPEYIYIWPRKYATITLRPIFFRFISHH